MYGLWGSTSFQLGMTAGELSTPVFARASPPQGVEIDTKSLTDSVKLLSSRRVARETSPPMLCATTYSVSNSYFRYNS